MKKIYFRADASGDIGYGHFIRTLALADMLKNDFECVFVTQSPTEYQRSEVSKFCRLVEVPATEEKFGLFLEMLEGDEIVVLDNYFYDTDYQRKIKEKGCKLVCIDDMHDKHYVADVVVNHAVYEKCLFDVESYTVLCLGLDWALLRTPFIESVEGGGSVTRQKKCIVFAFGGSDMFDLTKRVASVLERFEYSFDAIGIIGDGIKYRFEDLKYERVRFVKNLLAEEVAELFQCATYAILPASTMCLEAIACRSKLLVGYFVDNQAKFAEYLGKHRYAYFLDDMSSESFESNLEIALAEVINGGFQYEPNELITPGIRKRYIDLFKMLS